MELELADLLAQALREMHGKYIGNRPVKVRKSTWKERSLNNAKHGNDFTHSLAVSKKGEGLRKGLPSGSNKPTHGIGKDKRFHKSKPKNGMPW